MIAVFWAFDVSPCTNEVLTLIATRRAYGMVSWQLVRPFVRYSLHRDWIDHLWRYCFLACILDSAVFIDRVVGQPTAQLSRQEYLVDATWWPRRSTCRHTQLSTTLRVYFFKISVLNSWPNLFSRIAFVFCRSLPATDPIVRYTPVVRIDPYSCQLRARCTCSSDKWYNMRCVLFSLRQNR
jgi:hypothetical protein